MNHLESTTTILANSQFAALEPSWAGVNGPTQLRGLLVFASLFNEVLFVHDTQLADNPHLLSSFIRRAQSNQALFDFLLHLIREGIVRVAIRDGTFVRAKDELVPCHNLTDVLRSWREQGIAGAWVSGQATAETENMVKTIEEVLTENNCVRYGYLKVKSGFIERVRNTLLGASPVPPELDLGRLEPYVREQYEGIAAREWFSHSDIFALLRDAGIPLDDPLAQVHGLFDESAYADWHSANLTGSDAYQIGATPNRKGVSQVYLNEGDRLMNAALCRIPSISLDVLATISIDEVLELRSLARGLFATKRFLQASGAARGVEPIFRNYLEAFIGYWREVCDYLVVTRPELTRERTELGIFTQEQLPTISALSARYSSMTINLGLDILGLFFSSIKDLDADHRKGMVNKFTLRFLFHKESEHMREMRMAVPQHVWVDRNRMY